MVRPSKPVQPTRPNPLRNIREIRQPTPLALKSAAAASAAAAARAPPSRRPNRRTCPNRQCSSPQVEDDGVCHTCGSVADDANIVSEVQFGETSNGAAIVQGSYVGADQGGARSSGPGFGRGGYSTEDREQTVREGRRLMSAMGHALRIQDSTVGSGHQIFKIAAINNFIQGRRLDIVAAVCLYTACRKEKPCRIMLIDFADRIQVNVFKMGRIFKALHREITISRDGMQPVLPEDLIWRFAQKLEFGELTAKVAEDAIRMVQRMSLDWMVMGRRPSGVCGACLILAARMNNFRRTVTEVVYIVKVTTATIQKRLDEFKLTPSSALTVEEFLTNEFLESAHDPPSFYEKTEEFQKAKQAKKRKRKGHDAINMEENVEAGDQRRSKRQKNSTNQSSNSGTPAASVELRRDADGFAIPPTPSSQGDRANTSPPTSNSQANRVGPLTPNSQDNANIDPALLPEQADNQIDDQSGTTFEQLVSEFGDQLPEEEESPEDNSSSTPSASRTRGTRAGRGIHVSHEWARDEEELTAQINEMISDPHTNDHALQYAKATRHARQYIRMLDSTNPRKVISEDVHIGEDEFADDPEVQNCLLAEEEVAKKEKIWVNENKDWLRKEQLKEWKRRMDERGPKKATRKRIKKPRIGEGQTSAASSPAEAAIGVLKARAWSKKINYDAIATMFEDSNSARGGAGSGSGTAATSRITSTAPSSVDGDEGNREEGTPTPVITPAATTPGTATSTSGQARGREKEAEIQEEQNEEEDEEEDDEEEDVPDWRKDMLANYGPPADEEDDFEGFEDDEMID